MDTGFVIITPHFTTISKIRHDQCAVQAVQSRASQYMLDSIHHEASKVGTDHLIRNITSVWKQDPGIQELEEDGSQRDGGAALQGRGSGICGHVGQLCGE